MCVLLETCLEVVQGDLKVRRDSVQVDVNVWNVVKASDQVGRLETARDGTVLHDSLYCNNTKLLSTVFVSGYRERLTLILINMQRLYSCSKVNWHC